MRFLITIEGEEPFLCKTYEGELIDENSNIVVFDLWKNLYTKNGEIWETIEKII